MATKTQAPTISKKQFDANEPKLRKALRAWWDDESQSFDAAVAGTAAVWEGMPEIDSKAVVKASPVVKQFTGGDLDPKLIRRGGYASFDDLANDLCAKLRNACSSPSRAPSVNVTKRETLNARRS